MYVSRKVWAVGLGLACVAVLALVACRSIGRIDATWDLVLTDQVGEVPPVEGD